jgi:peroxiredoxin Q/BCP
MTGPAAGDQIDDFELPDETGRPRRLSELVAEGPVVLFFYPAAMTYGCTKESCHFRDLAEEFGALGAHPVGVSVDPVTKQAEFKETHRLGMPLLSDAEGTLAQAMGVKRRFGPIPVQRTTFVIDEHRRVLARIHTEFQMGAHADRALEVLRQRQSA